MLRKRSLSQFHSLIVGLHAKKTLVCAYYIVDLSSLSLTLIYFFFFIRVMRDRLTPTKEIAVLCLKNTEHGSNKITRATNHLQIYIHSYA